MTDDMLVKLLISERGDGNGNVDLSGLNFGKKHLILSRIRATTIDNSGQVAIGPIKNSNQRADGIMNKGQKSTFIIDNRFLEYEKLMT